MVEGGRTSDQFSPFSFQFCRGFSPFFTASLGPFLSLGRTRPRRQRASPRPSLFPSTRLQSILPRGRHERPRLPLSS